jgi:hypothetical protein
MKTHKNKFFSAAAIAAGLIATVAIAHTVNTHPTRAQAPHAREMSAAPGRMSTTPRNGSIVCGMAIAADCEKIGPLLPM